MKTLLITGFAPFGGETINPSWEAVSRLPDVIGDCRVHKLEIPVVFGTSPAVVLEAAAELRPDCILCVGQAGGRKAVTPELVAINVRDAKIPDNDGNQPWDEPVIPGGENALFSTLPVRAMTDAIQARGIPAALSYSAGAYVCNDTLYTLLHHYQGTDIRCAFLHVPYLPEQAGADKPSLPLSDMVSALIAAIETF